MTVPREPKPETDSLETADYDYELPPELIAQTPLDQRDASRLLVLEKHTGAMHHARFTDLGACLAAGDLLVANNSRVIPARLNGRRLPGGGNTEILLLRKSADVWSALAKPAKRLTTGSRLEFHDRWSGGVAATATVLANVGAGEVLLRFDADADSHLADFGSAPLPPYIHAPLSDPTRYQTVYGQIPGSVAAPTAGLHFTDDALSRLRARGIDWAEVTLHVGVDTFRPMSVSNAKDHRIHAEWCEVSEETALSIAACRKRGGRVVAVGTTSARALETIGRKWRDEFPAGFSGMTDAFIVPGHRWALVDGLVTNFHLPRSTLLLLVSALAGRESILRAYTEAIRRRYRFYSFGDAMLIV